MSRTKISIWYKDNEQEVDGASPGAQHNTSPQLPSSYGVFLFFIYDNIEGGEKKGGGGGWGKPHNLIRGSQLLSSPSPTSVGASAPSGASASVVVASSACAAGGASASASDASSASAGGGS